MKLINIKKNKAITDQISLCSFFNPDYIYIPIYDNQITLNKQKKIFKDSLIFSSSNIRSSVSGSVVKIDNFLVQKKLLPCLVIKNDYKEEKNLTLNKKEEYTKEYLFKCLKKLKYYNLIELLKKDNVKTIIFNTVQDEIYVKNKIIIFKENVSLILDFLDYLKIFFNCLNNTIVVKNTDNDIIEDCLNVIGTYPDITITLVKDYYLLGNKNGLLNYLKKKEEDVLYLDIVEVLEIANMFFYQKNDSTRFITIYGDVLKQSLVLNVKKYCLIEEIISKYVFFNAKDVLFIANSLLNGYEIDISKTILTDDIISIGIMKKKKIKEYPCLNCGKCIEYCPVSIDIIKCLKNNQTNKNCGNCGICTYICPANITIHEKIKEEV